MNEFYCCECGARIENSNFGIAYLCEDCDKKQEDSKKEDEELMEYCMFHHFHC